MVTRRYSGESSPGEGATVRSSVTAQSCRHPVVVRGRGLLRCRYAFDRGFRSMAGEILLDFDGAVAIVTNNRPEKHNAFTDSSDLELFEIFRELEGRSDVRAIVWRGNGKSFSSGRDVEAIGGATRTEDISQLELMERGHRFAKTVINMPAPVIVEMKGWSIGGSFERALLCDMRIAGESARMMLPEVKHGVIPDTGGIARLFHMAGHGVATDLALTGRVMGAAEALQHGVVSRWCPTINCETDDARDRARNREGTGVHGEDGPAHHQAPGQRDRRDVDGRRSDRADAGVRLARLQRDEGRARRAARAELPPPVETAVRVRARP